jgi:pyridoxamine 5'-phosphate oxidase
VREDELAARREEYRSHGIDRGELADDPFVQFQRWYDDWLALDRYDANAMAVATADADGRPSVRFVLLKGLDHGFVFYSNTRSHKGHDLAVNPQASIVFAWVEVQRQVRVTGSVELVDEATTDAYWASRPRGSQLGAWASDQSAPIADRAALEARYADAGARYEGSEIPRPADWWKGYRVVPDDFEFWQGRANRLHDRFAYRRSGPGQPWAITRLMP